MRGICCLSLLHTSIPLQWTGFPSGRIFLHISKEIGYLFFSWVTELRQASKRTGRQGGSQQRTVEAEEAAAEAPGAKPVCGPARSLFAVLGGGGHPEPAAPGTPGPAVTQLKENEKKKTKPERGWGGVGERKAWRSHRAAAQRGGAGWSGAGRRLLRRGVAAHPRARQHPRRLHPGQSPRTSRCLVLRDLLFLGALFFQLPAAWLASGGRRAANREMRFQHHLRYRFSDTECFFFQFQN